MELTSEILDQVTQIADDEEVMDVLDALDDKEHRNNLYRTLDSTRGEDIHLIFKIKEPPEQFPLVRYYVLSRYAKEGDGGLVLHMSPNHEAIIAVMKYQVNNLPPEAQELYIDKISEVSIVLRNLSEED